MINVPGILNRGPDCLSRKKTRVSMVKVFNVSDSVG